MSVHSGHSRAGPQWPFGTFIVTPIIDVGTLPYWSSGDVNNLSLIKGMTILAI